MEHYTDAQREAVVEIVARNQQYEALRRARALGVPLEVVAREARVALSEVRRVTERVPVN